MLTKRFRLAGAYSMSLLRVDRRALVAIGGVDWSAVNSPSEDPSGKRILST